MIKRTKYLNKIIPFIDKNLIKALIGVRRSGKTVLLTQIKEHLLNNNVDEKQIIYMNFESFLNRKYLNGLDLYDYIYNISKSLNKKIYLLLDEIQDVKEWEKVIASLMVDINCDIYITGSNSNCYLVNLQLILLEDMFILKYILLHFVNLKNMLYNWIEKFLMMIYSMNTCSLGDYHNVFYWMKSNQKVHI